jgi:RNA polymerase sigma-70 factor, ECF subfamily
MPERTRESPKPLDPALLPEGVSSQTVATSVAVLAGDTALASDRSLGRRASAGDAAAARAIYDTHGPRVYRLIYRLTGNADRTQDLTQETFIRAFAKLSQYRGEVPLGAWLRSVALSVAYNGLRQDGTRRGREVELVESSAVAEGSPERSVLRSQIAAAVDKLPEIYRSVVVLHDVEGYTHEEIADTLGIPAGTSRARLTYARAQLREALTQPSAERKRVINASTRF